MTRIATQKDLAKPNKGVRNPPNYDYMASAQSFVPGGCTFPIFAHPGIAITPNNLPEPLTEMFPKSALNPYAMFCVHVPLAASQKWRQRLIPEYTEDDCWVTPRITIRPSGKHGHMLVTAISKDLDGVNVYEGIGELTMTSRSNPEKYLYEPKQTVASHLFNESEPRLRDQPQPSTSQSRLAEGLSSISSIKNFKNWVKNSKVGDNVAPFNIRHFDLDEETGFVQNVVITGDDDEDALVLTRLRKPLYNDGEANRVLRQILKDAAQKIRIDPSKLEFSMVEEALVKSAASPPTNEYLSEALAQEWMAQRASLTESFRADTLIGIRASLAERPMQAGISA